MHFFLFSVFIDLSVKKSELPKPTKKGVAKVTVKKSVLKKLKAAKKVTYHATYLKDTVKKLLKLKNKD